MTNMKLLKNSEAMCVVFIFLAIIGMFFSTPRSAGADEPMHQATGWYAIHNGYTPNTNYTKVQDIPNSLTVIPCFAFRSEIGADCLPSRNSISNQTSEYAIFSYPPLYYYFVGIGQVLTEKVVGLEFADLGGRVFSLILNLAILFFAFKKLRNIYPKPASLFMLIATPMIFFYLIVVNPSGLEISSAILFAIYFYGFLFEKFVKLPTLSSNQNFSKLGLGIAAFILLNSRSLGIVWFVALTFMALVGTGVRLSWRQMIGITIPSMPGVIVALVTIIIKGNSLPILPGYTPVDTNFAFYLKAFVRTMTAFPDRFSQMIGNLGWLDTPTPSFIIFSGVAVWAVYFSRYGSSTLGRFNFGLIIFVYLVVIPGIIETINWNRWPGWWQGRYTLPVLVGSILIYFLHLSKTRDLNLTPLILFSGILNIIMVIQNIFRYSFGIKDYFPIDVSSPQIGYVNFTFASVASIGMIFFLLKIRKSLNLNKREHIQRIQNAIEKEWI